MQHSFEEVKQFAHELPEEQRIQLADSLYESVGFDEPEEDEGGDEPDIDAEDDADDMIEPPAPVRRAPEIALPSPRVDLAPRPPVAAPRVENTAGVRKLDTAKLEAALQDLLACRQLLDSALKDG